METMRLQEPGEEQKQTRLLLQWGAFIPFTHVPSVSLVCNCSSCEAGTSQLAALVTCSVFIHLWVTGRFEINAEVPAAHVWVVVGGLSGCSDFVPQLLTNPLLLLDFCW